MGSETPATIASALAEARSAKQSVDVSLAERCNSRVIIATVVVRALRALTNLFDPSMSALPIMPKQNWASVGLFTH